MFKFILIFLLILGEGNILTAQESLDKDTKILYKLNNNQPFWNEEEKVKKLLDLLNLSHLKGLNQKEYKIKDINEINLTKTTIKYCKDLYFGRIKPKEIFDTWNIPTKGNFPYKELSEVLVRGYIDEIDNICEPKLEQYKLLKSILEEYYQIKDEELPKIKSDLSFGNKSEEVINLKKILYFYGDYVNQENLNSDIFDEEVLKAVKSFQERHQLEPDGVVGSKTRFELNKSIQERIKTIIINMEKYRWLPEDLYPERIEINIPSFNLKYFKNNKEILEMKVIVGKNYVEDFRPTPVYYGKIIGITINPYWYVPYKIAIKDILPKIKKNPKYLETHKFKVLNNDNEEVDYEKIDWNMYDENNFPFNLVQEPNKRNSLGRIKIAFSNPFGIFLHDTPDKSLFNKTKRSFSSGCIRLEKPITLSALLLNKSEKEILKMLNSEETIGLRVNKNILVYILYFTVEVKNGKIFFYDDIYKFDQKIFKKLNQEDG